MSLQVKVAQGVLQGKENVSQSGQKYYSFEGIPYAKPPIGALRFRDPQDSEPWTGVRDATTPGNKCAQINPYGKKTFEGSEDCLYLNVYTPSLPHEKIERLPVIFFIHGGRFLVGYGDYYKPDFFIKNNVILVTINYRLNILGFLCLDIPEAPGNAGMKDTIMALKWVQNNIENFNGDSNNITAFGESAGASVVTSYLCTKMADGLLKKVIAQSGNCLSDLFMIEEDNLRNATNIASILGKELINQKDVHNFLINTAVEDLIYALAVAELNRPPGAISPYFLPVIEKQFPNVQRYFEEHPIITISENRYKKLPIITGLHSHEGALFLNKDEYGNIIYEDKLHCFIPKYLFIEKDSLEEKKLAKKLHDFYFKNDNEKSLSYINFLSDIYFNRDAMIFNELISKFHNELFVYKFFYSGNMNTRIMKNLKIKGATHGDIAQYQFYRKSKADKCSEKDEKIINFLSETWSNFAKSGIPTWSNQKFKWLPYTQDEKYCLHIDEDIKLVQNDDLDLYNFWRTIVVKRAKL